MKSLSRSLAVVAAIAIGIAWQWNSYSATSVLLQDQQDQAETTAASGTRVFEFAVTVLAPKRGEQEASSVLHPSEVTTVLSNGRPFKLLTSENGPTNIKITHIRDNTFEVDIDGDIHTVSSGVGEYFAVATKHNHQVIAYNVGILGIYGGGTFPIEPKRGVVKAVIQLDDRPDFDEPTGKCEFYLKPSVQDLYINAGQAVVGPLTKDANVKIEISGYSKTSRRSPRSLTITESNGKKTTGQLTPVSYGVTYEPYYILSPEYPRTDPTDGECEVMLKFGPYVDYFTIQWKQ